MSRYERLPSTRVVSAPSQAARVAVLAVIGAIAVVAAVGAGFGVSAWRRHDLAADNIVAINGTVTNGNVTNLKSESGMITTLMSEGVTTTTLTSQSGTITNLETQEGVITNLESEEINATTLTSQSGTIVNLETEEGVITNLEVTMQKFSQVRLFKCSKSLCSKEKNGGAPFAISPSQVCAQKWADFSAFGCLARHCSICACRLWNECLEHLVFEQ